MHSTHTYTQENSHRMSSKNVHPGVLKHMHVYTIYTKNTCIQTFIHCTHTHTQENSHRMSSNMCIQAYFDRIPHEKACLTSIGPYALRTTTRQGIDEYIRSHVTDNTALLNLVMTVNVWQKIGNQDLTKLFQSLAQVAPQRLEEMTFFGWASFVFDCEDVEVVQIALSTCHSLRSLCMPTTTHNGMCRILEHMARNTQLQTLGLSINKAAECANALEGMLAANSSLHKLSFDCYDAHLPAISRALGNALL
jgi:hypothetical protein